MTPMQRDAYNSGVHDALALARACGDALAPAAVDRVTRLGFAIAALDAFVEEGRELLIEAPAEVGAGEVRPLVPLPLAALAAPVVAAPAAVPDLAQRRVEARARGCTGDLCGDCLNLTMVRNGTCLKCDTCGGTS